jgi:sialic acid synthase SpsE
MALNFIEGKCFVIAEAGTCHAGPEKQRLGKAKSLVESAARMGADAVKFQWFSPSPGPQSMFRWIEGDDMRAQRWAASYMDMEKWREVRDLALGHGIVLLASTFETLTSEWLWGLDIPATKVASRVAQSFPYHRVDLPKPFLISDGMGLPAAIPPQSILLQCEANYPSTAKWVRADGFSDHSGEIFLGIDAIARGCPLLEVHIYNGWPDEAGPDKPASISQFDLGTICDARDYYYERTRGK